MKRLRASLLLLVALPALAFAVAGIAVVVSSRASLQPVLDRHAATRAAEYFRYYRSSRLAEMPESLDRLEAGAAELDVERYTIYDDAGRVTETYPLNAPPLPLAIDTEQSAPMLDAARRGHAVLDLMAIDGQPVWLAYLPGNEQIAVVLRDVSPELAERFAERTGYDLALYLDASLVQASGGSFVEALPATLTDSLASFDRALAVELARAPIAVAPIKDFDDWDATGAVVVRAGEGAPLPPPPSLPNAPIAPMSALVLAAAATLLIVWRVTRTSSTERRAQNLRRGFAIALAPPALAAFWLVQADAEMSARATDAMIEVSYRCITLMTIEEPDSIPANVAAAFLGTDLVVTDGPTVLEASRPELATADYSGLEPGIGRANVAGRRMAYAKTEGGGAWPILLTTPLEDARKTTLFWLAGLYGLLAVGVLIYASLAFAAENAIELREAKTAWRFVSPSMILLLLFSAAPLLFAFYLSFHRWNLLEPAKPFVGLDHYIDLARDGLFWNAAKNTAIYSLYVPATMVFALAVAILLNRKIKGVALLRAVFFLPYITSFVAISIVWQWMYDPDFGLFNWSLGLVGLGPFPWLNSPSTALLALIIMAVWIHIGFQMIIFLAGLQAIPGEFYEAAMIDGAGPWRRFWRITLPLLKPTTFFVLVTSIIGSFQVFTFVYVMTEGGPLHATDVIVYHIYQNAWQFLRMGYASAMSWVLFAVIFVITLLQFRFLGRRTAPS
jgi:ABC-type sugar transport system permease subunit